jgi:hypothetical protein
VFFFLREKELNAKDIHKEIFSVCGGKCLSRKAVHNWVQIFSRGPSKSQMMPDQMLNWPRQQSKDFYDEGFDAVVKRWDKRMNVGTGYIEK